jgi:hypothetical protein
MLFSSYIFSIEATVREREGALVVLEQKIDNLYPGYKWPSDRIEDLPGNEMEKILDVDKEINKFSFKSLSVDELGIVERYGGYLMTVPPEHRYKLHERNIGRKTMKEGTTSWFQPYRVYVGCDIDELQRPAELDRPTNVLGHIKWYYKRARLWAYLRYSPDPKVWVSENEISIPKAEWKALLHRETWRRDWPWHMRWIRPITEKFWGEKNRY